MGLAPQSTAPEVPPTTGTVAASISSQPTDPKDPEGFLRRCAGYNKKNRVRCSGVIGKNSHYTKNSHPTFLPTCHAHKDQQSYAGWCQFLQEDGERCGRLFRWTPPYLQLCSEHQGHPDTPCYFVGLPLELRLEIFRYLLPDRPIGSSTALVHTNTESQSPGFNGLYMSCAHTGPRAELWRSHSSPYEQTTADSVFKTPLLNLLLVNRQISAEVKDLFYSTIPFTIDVRKDGTYMCGRRLLEPLRADGSSHAFTDRADWLKTKFLMTFDWAAVKNYNVHIIVENCKNGERSGYAWDEEVEMYDIRDYIGVVVSGILSKSRNLCKLNVRLGISKFRWTSEQLLANAKTLVGPFERLRNVRQPRFHGVYDGALETHFSHVLALPMPVEGGAPVPCHPPTTPICSVPSLPTDRPLPVFQDPHFSEFRADWQRSISSSADFSLIQKPPIYAMFSEFKNFYTKLALLLPDIMVRKGKHAFLHRARVARERENVEAFRILRNELIECWYVYLEQEERKKQDMNRRLSKLLDADVYPSAYDEEIDYTYASRTKSSESGPSAQAPLALDIGYTKQDGVSIQSTGNHHAQSQATFQQQLAQMRQQYLDAQKHEPLAVGPDVSLHNRQVPKSATSTQYTRKDTAQQSAIGSPPMSPPKVPSATTPNQEQQKWYPSQGSTINSEAPNAYSSSSSSSPSTYSANLSPTTDTSSTPFTPPTPTQPMHFGEGANTYPWNAWYEDGNHNGGESSKTSTFSHLNASLPGLSNDSVSSKRPSLDSLVCEAPKRQSVASSTGRGYIQRNENGDEIMIMDDDYVDVFREWADRPEGYVGKGKGKATAPADAEVLAHWNQQQHGRQMHMQMCEAEYLGKAASL